MRMNIFKDYPISPLFLNKSKPHPLKICTSYQIRLKSAKDFFRRIRLKVKVDTGEKDERCTIMQAYLWAITRWANKWIVYFVQDTQHLYYDELPIISTSITCIKTLLNTKYMYKYTIMALISFLYSHPNRTISEFQVINFYNFSIRACNHSKYISLQSWLKFELYEFTKMHTNIVIFIHLY